MAQFDPNFDMADPWSRFAADRSACPIGRVMRDDGFTFHRINTYDLIREASRRHDLFSNRLGVGPRGPHREGEQVLEYTDPPAHTIHRQLIGKAFSVARVNEKADRIQQIADDLIDEIVATGTNRFELRRQFARPLPSQVIAEILGVPSNDRAQFIAWSERIEAVAGDLVLSEEDEQVRRTFLDYCLAQLRSRLEHPRDDLLTTIMHAQVEGQRFTEIEAAAMVRLLLAAGNGTTSIGASNLVYQLEKHPDQKARLLADMDGLLESCVEEGFRFDCPVKGNFRGVLGHGEIGDVKVEPGERIYMLYASGNHDPSRYDRPDEFVIDRDWPKLPRHLAFGYGIHFCLGADLARLETQIGIRTLYTRLPNLRIAQGFTPSQVPGMTFRTWEKLEMEFDGPVAGR